MKMTPDSRRPDAADTDPDLPFSGESALRLRLEEDIATIHDYRFGNITRDLGEADEAIIEHVLEITGDAPVHQAGGYARFSQEDPRALQAGEPEWLLLLQVDTDSNDHIKIMWGDAGIGSFFIRRDDLEKLDFSRVWYSWDCY